MRPNRLIFVTGTGTDIGKTWVSVRLLEAARATGRKVAARKPLQSFSPGDRTTDAAELGAATGEDARAICLMGLAAPMAPPMAAAALGVEVPTIAELCDWITRSWGECDLGLVEGAGGLASPLGADGDCADLARLLRPDVVVVVGDPALGVINSIRLTVAALAGLAVVVHLNRFEAADDLHRRNLDWLTGHDGLIVTTGVGELLEAVG
jgi:dethiobiotin synthetase